MKIFDDMRSIDHNLIDLYLTKSGWKKVKTNRSGIDAYIDSSEDNKIFIYIPNNSKMQGYYERIGQSIAAIAEYENKEVSSIARIIKNYDRDFHNYRIMTHRDSIPIILLEELLNSAKTSLKEAARLEHGHYINALKKDEKAIAKEHKDEAKMFVSNCSFSHTWQGSFGITIEIPLMPPSIGMFDDTIDTLGRKVTKRILNSFNIIDEAVRQESYNYIFDNIQDKSDILILSNYTLLNEYIQSNEIDFSVETSPSIKFTDVNNKALPYKINYRTLQYLQQAVEQISRDEDVLEIEITGFPETISATQLVLIHDELASDRKVVVRGMSPQINEVSLKMELSLENYKKAIRAQDEIRSVAVRCKVKKRLRGWDVLEVYRFDLI